MEFLRRTSYLGKFTGLFILVGVLLAILSFGVLHLEQLRLKERIDQDRGQIVLSFKQSEYQRMLQGYDDLLHAIRENPQFRAYIKAPQQHREDIKGLFKTLSASDANIMQLRYLDAKGMEKVRVDRYEIGQAPFVVPQAGLQDKAHRDYFQETAKKRAEELYISRLDLNIEHKKVEIPYRPVLRFGIPVYEKGFEGIIIVNVFMQAILENLIDSYMFNVFIYDESGCLLKTNNASFKNWSCYQEGPFEVTHPERTSFRLLHQAVLSETNGTLYLGLGERDASEWLIDTIREAFIVLVLVIIPVGFLLALFLARIPKRLFDELEERQALLIHQARHAAMGELISNLAHHWRQPLNALGLQIQDLREAYNYGEINEAYLDNMIGTSMTTIQAMSENINNLRAFVQSSEEQQRFSMHEVVLSTTAMFTEEFNRQNIHVKFEGEDAMITGYYNEIKQVIYSIINNAKEAILQQRETDPGLQGMIFITGTKEHIVIRDNGGGIPKGIKERIFEPYYTTKFQSAGVGLGLFLAKNIIEERMHGQLLVRNVENGAEFEIVLPENRDFN